MSCIYYFNNKTFKSELELDQELLKLMQISNNIHDLVFSRKYSEQSEKNNRMLLDGDLYAKQLKEENQPKTSITGSDIASWIDSEYWGADDHIKDSLKGYVSVTQLIQGIKVTGEDGKSHPVFPIWQADAFWSHMTPYLTDMENWFNKPHPETGKIFITQELVDALFNQKNAKPQNIPIDQISKYRTRMENYWKSQALIGNVTHKLLRIAIEGFFDKIHPKTSPEDLVKDMMHYVPSTELAKRADSRDMSVSGIIDNAIKQNGGQSIFNTKEDYTTFLNSIAATAIKLCSTIKKKYPNNPRVYCELLVTGKPTETFSPLDVLGQIDLLVIDDDCNVGIFDYKCSPKLYSEFDSAKKRTFMYQLAIYRRLVKKLGIIHQREIDINVIPIQFIDFNYDDDLNELKKPGRVTVSAVNLNDKTSKNILRDLDVEMDQSVEQNINLVIDAPILVQDDDAIETNVNKFISTIAPEWFDFRDINSESKLQEKVLQFIDNHGGIQKSENEDGQYFFNYTRLNKIITGSNEIEIIDQIKKIWKKSRGQAAVKATKIQNEIIKVKTEHNKYTHKSVGKLRDPESGSYEYVEKMLGKYAETQWEVITKNTVGIKPEIVQLLEAHGMLLFKNRFSNVIDVVKVANAAIDEVVLLGPKNDRRKYILGTFMSDDTQINDVTTPPLAAIEGNLELMETLAILNYIPKTLNKLGTSIGEIKVINPDGYKGIGGIDAPSEQLVRNFRKLFAFAGLDNCQITMSDQNGNVKISTHYELVAKELQTIKSKVELSEGYKYLTDEVLTLSDAINASIINNLNKEEKLLKMQHLKEVLERNYPNLKGKPIADIDSSTHPEVKIYNEVLLSIAELQGVQLTQQTKSHPMYFGKLNKILTKGWQGSRIDNPGMLESQNLNNLTYLTERAYQNVRSSTSAFNQKLRGAISKLKKARGYSALSKYTLGNQTSIYQNLYDKNAKKAGKLQLKPLDHPTLTNEEKEFLTFALQKFAYDRGVIEDIVVIKSDGTFNEKAFWEAYKAYPEQILQIPLTRASFSSTVSSSGGLLKGLQVLFRQWLPSNIKSYLSGKFYELLDTTPDANNKSQKDKALSGEIFEMINRVKNSYNPNLREKLLTHYNPETGILEHNTDLYETNLEKLLLYSEFSTSMERELNKVFPSLKAIITSLSLQGTVQNMNFANDVNYALDYIKNKILGLPLENMDEYGILQLVTSELMSNTSKLALAFNPLQLYQIIDGIWKDILLIMQKPDVDLPEDSAFTKKNMSDAFLWILQDTTHFGDGISLGEALNDIYGLNDRDINVFTDRINSDTAGIFNFWSLGFRFASRPDYYNRMTIFGALMRRDGSFKAHSMIDGKLTYDWTQDERFKIYAQGKKTHPDYNKQKALYLAMAQEFILEGARNPDGTLFTIENDDKPSPLPRAYTTKQSESMKAIADKIYGYYTHEKKSMIQSFTIGALFMQMHTYWSAKKNQYLAGHGFSQEGDFVQYKELQPDGTYIDYYTDENGLPTKINTGVPYMVWKGRPYEGIIVTLSKLTRDIFLGSRGEDGKVLTDENGTELRGWGYMYDKNFGEHADANLRRLYRANLYRLSYDLLMYLSLGMILSPAMMNAVKKYIKEHDNNSLLQASINTTLFGMAKMFKSSTDDFNALKSLTGQVVDWDPFSLSMVRRVAAASVNLFDEDKDSFDVFIKLASATRNTEPLWDYAKYSLTGRYIGESE